MRGRALNRSRAASRPYLKGFEQQALTSVTKMEAATALRLGESFGEIMTKGRSFRTGTSVATLGLNDAIPSGLEDRMT